MESGVRQSNDRLSRGSPERGVYTSHQLLMLTAPRHCLTIAILACSAFGTAQQMNDRKPSDGSEKAAPSATVTGHVYLDDAKAPCRKATVRLQPVALLQTDAPPNRRGGHDQGGPVTMEIEAQFDGRFSFTHVALGSYYVIAACPGYISPLLALSLAESRSPGEEGPLGSQEKAAGNKILESFTKVDVQSNLPTSADVVLQRGGAINGNITYDDGEPAAGIEVAPLIRTLRDGKDAWMRIGLQPDRLMFSNVTDDRGNYRISDLPAGKYAVEVDLNVSDSKTYITAFGSSGSNSTSHSSRLAIYSGNTPRMKDAVGFTIRPPEERTGEDIVIPISKLHTIRGNIVSAHDAHVVNSGQVMLLNADDHTPVGSGQLTEDDPSFTFSFVFEGDYVLSVPVAADVDYVPVPAASGNMGPPQFNAHVLHFYGSSSVRLHVDGDTDGVVIHVGEPTAKEAQMYKETLRQQELKEKQTNDPQ